MGISVSYGFFKTIGETKMGTSNFMQMGSETIFSVELENDFDYEDTVLNLTEFMQNKFGDDFSTSDDYLNFNRSYPSRMVGFVENQVSKHYLREKKDKTGDLMDVEVSFETRVFTSSGYYSGMNLDYLTEITVIVGGTDEDVFTLDECTNGLLEAVKECMDSSDLLEYSSDALKYMYADWITTFIDKEHTKLNKKLDKVLAQVAQPLEVFARFSNGETMYIDSKKDKKVA
jgi:hypothetical protein